MNHVERKRLVRQANALRTPTPFPAVEYHLRAPTAAADRVAHDDYRFAKQLESLAGPPLTSDVVRVAAGELQKDFTSKAAVCLELPRLFRDGHEFEVLIVSNSEELAYALKSTFSFI